MSSALAIEIVPYDARWPRSFACESKRILDAVPYLALRIEHVGSTSVRGLAAKPIVDILIGVPRLRDAVDCIPRLARIGYRYVPSTEILMPHRRFFRRVVAGRRTHHIHIVANDHPDWTDLTLFRNYLRTHRGTARAYEDLKRHLAYRYRYNAAAYGNGKTRFIQSTLQRAHKESRYRRVQMNDPYRVTLAAISLRL